MADKIEPFRVEVPVEVLADLRARLSSTRFPDEVPDTGWEYGTNLAYLKELVEYWRTKYDWRAHEREINRFAHFKASVDGLGIHFIHEKGKGPNPKPLLLIHGWPGSIYEFMEIIPMLTDPAAHGGDARDSFTVIAPSLPGYGFSDHPRARAMNIQAMAELFHKLMTETLGYKRYAVQGGDWGAAITSRIGEVHADSVFGIHINMIAIGPAEGRSAPELTPEEKVFLGDLEKFRTRRDRLPMDPGDQAADARVRAQRFAGWAAGVDRREVPHVERLPWRRREELHARPTADQRDDLLGHADD